MKKKMIITVMTLSAMCLFGGCKKEPEAKSPMPVAEEINSTEIQTELETSENQTTKQQPEILATNLTQQELPMECIDYSIDSYNGLQQFSYQLFQQNIGDENPVISPISAYLALSMAGFGADGTTLQEFQKVLGEMDDMAIYSDNFMSTLQQQSENLTLSLANSVWMDNHFTADKSWLGEVKSFTRADVFQSDITSIETMNSMNQWVKQHTNGLIEQILEKPLDSDTRLALLNTLYFKAKWETPFEQMDTYTEAFRLENGSVIPNKEAAENYHNDSSSTVDVPMMHKYGEYYSYIANEFAEGVILPYQNSSTAEIYNMPDMPVEEDAKGVCATPNLAFIALKPRNTENYQKFNRQTKYEETLTDYLIGESTVRDMYRMLTDEVIADLLVNRQTKLVNLKLPKFEITFEKKLNESLKNIGLKECFDEEKANFSKMGTTTAGGNLYIDLVFQKAKIIVDEEGTEAAAVTEVLIKEECASIIDEEPINVYFDEPFLYMIMDMDKEVPLFIGIMDNPEV